MKARLINFISRYIRLQGSNTDRALTADEWGAHYNVSVLQNLCERIKKNEISSWTSEIIALTSENDSVLEIGSGSGEASLVLAINGRKSTALDFSRECLSLSEAAAKELNCSVRTICADAFQPLSFNDNEFDMIFQAGLLEHFEQDKRIALLKNWGRCCRRMVSMIPNAASLAYRTGKALREQTGRWTWGKELPQYTLFAEFQAAGFSVKKEYTIGIHDALYFLPRFHYLRKALSRWQRENPCGDNCGQGYLLVTVGDKITS